MKNANIARVGSVLYALVVAFFGINHFLSGTGMQKMVPSFLPGGVFWVYFTGAAMILAAVAFLINRQTRLAGILLAVFLLLIVLTVHLPAVINAPDEGARRLPQINLLKDTGLAAAALMIAGKGV